MITVERRWWGAVIAAVICVLGASAPALAGPPGKWTQVTSEAQPQNTSEVGLERTADGVLHVLWHRDSGGTEEVVHSSISPDANTVSGPHGLISTANAINNRVDLIPGPGGGIRAIFAGIFPGAPAFSDGVATATSTDGGATWSAVAPASENDPLVPHDGTAYIASGLSGGLAADGAVVTIWGDSSPSGAGFHVGLDPATPDVPLSPTLCEGDPNVATDAVSGELMLAWRCVATDSIQVLRSNGALVSAPKSAAAWAQQRVGISGRIGADGVYIAYGSGTNPLRGRPALWRVGAGSAKVIKQPRDAEHTTLAPAPGGRLWIVWEGSDRGKRIFATRTNPAATRFGEIVSVNPPKGTDAIYRLAAEGSEGPLDVLALVGRGGDDIAHWHQRLLPGLTVRAKPKQVAAGKGASFKVTDAGAPVAKAKLTLKLGKKKLKATTNAKGIAKLKLPKGTRPGRYTATASKSGYTAGKGKLRVK